jgi:hypothetical protein
MQPSSWTCVRRPSPFLRGRRSSCRSAAQALFPRCSSGSASTGARKQGKEEGDGQQGLVNRRTAIGAALVAASPLLFPGRVRAQGTAAPADTFVVLLKGLYQPVVHGPNLGLSAVDLSDGSYSTTKIYPVSGTPGNTNLNKAIGDFYVQFAGALCAYHIPGGSFAMQFTGSNAAFEPDGAGGRFLVGTFELDVI